MKRIISFLKRTFKIGHERKFTPPNVRHMLLAWFIAFVLICIVPALLPEILKLFGSLFMFIPTRLGLLEQVKVEQVFVTQIEPTPMSIRASRPGRYLMYTDDWDLLSYNDSATQPWLRITSETTCKFIAVSVIHRGLRLYDPVFVSGRPVLSFEIETPDDYEFRPLFELASAIPVSIVPDYTTGKELTLFFVYLAQYSLVIIPLTIIFYWRYRARANLRRAEQEQKRKQSDAFWESEIKRAKKG